MAGASVKISGGEVWKKAFEPYLKGAKGGVKVGVLEGATYGPETEHAGQLVAPVAAVHEFGSSDGRIPARSFMRSTLRRKNEDWLKEVAAYLKSNPAQIKAAFFILGEMAAKDIQETIDWGIDPPTKPATVLRKAKRGKEVDNTPLIDTGTLQEAIQHEVF